MSKSGEIDGANKHFTKDLGLVPTPNADNGDLKLSVADILGTSRVLARLLGASKSPSVSVLVGEFKPDLEDQLGHAIRREERERGMATRGKGRILHRALVTAGIFVSLAVGAPVVTSLEQAVLTSLSSPSDAISSTATDTESARVRQMEEFERNHTLGREPSALSYSGWNIRYPTKEEGVDYVRSKVPNSVQFLYSKESIKFDDGGYTNIEFSDHIGSDGTPIPMISVVMNTNVYDRWVLANQQDRSLDTRVVQFEQPRTGKIKYLTVKRIKAQITQFQLELMDRVQAKH